MLGEVMHSMRFNVFSETQRNKKPYACLCWGRSCIPCVFNVFSEAQRNNNKSVLAYAEGGHALHVF